MVKRLELFFMKKDPNTLIANSVYLHRIGTSQEKISSFSREKVKNLTYLYHALRVLTIS